MSSVIVHRPWTSPTFHQPTVVRQFEIWADVINAAAAVLRPLLVSAGIITAAATWSAPARADPLPDSITNTLNKVGVGDNGPVSTAIATIGQSICPMLVQPGATFASVASQMAGNTGLSPAIAGFVTSMAIQMECPGIMNSIANGNLPFPLQLPGANQASLIPFQLPGANPVPPMTIASPGAGPAPPNPSQL
jgi:Protein of unknown function (DUF732)